jgi:hypothetical protein
MSPIRACCASWRRAGVAFAESGVVMGMMVAHPTAGLFGFGLNASGRGRGLLSPGVGAAAGLGGLAACDVLAW